MDHIKDSSNERLLAINALTEITEQGGYNNIILKKILNNHNSLPTMKKAFITETVNGTLRNLIYIDFIINTYASISTKKMKPFIRNVLRTAIYQIKFMDRIPPSAACNESVNLVKASSFKNLSGFANGVLRNIIRDPNKLKLPDEKKEPVQYLSVVYSYSVEILEYWLEEFDYETVKKICMANQNAPKVSVFTNIAKTNKTELANVLREEGITVDDGSLSAYTLNLSQTSDITATKSFKDGLYHIIDESSVLAVEILNPKHGDVIIDVCAAPGGKSFCAALFMENTGKIMSCDIHDHKIKLMQESMHRLGIQNINTEKADATKNDPNKIALADCLLIDAPCSGLGLVRKKPDIKYTKTREDIRSLVPIQRSILENCWQYVKPGGLLLYSTCTISKEENLDNINWFKKNFPFESENIENVLPVQLKTDTAKDGYVQLIPDEKGWDGFFIAKLRRKG